MPSQESNSHLHSNPSSCSRLLNPLRHGIHFLIYISHPTTVNEHFPDQSFHWEKPGEIRKVSSSKIVETCYTRILEKEDQKDARFGTTILRCSCPCGGNGWDAERLSKKQQRETQKSAAVTLNDREIKIGLSPAEGDPNKGQIFIWDPERGYSKERINWKPSVFQRTKAQLWITSTPNWTEVLLSYLPARNKGNLWKKLHNIQSRKSSRILCAQYPTFDQK